MKRSIPLLIGIVAFTLQNVSAQYQTNILFTTANDWSLWTGNGSTVAVDSTFSSDNDTVNGLGNTGGGTGTGNGSLAITLTTFAGTFGQIAVPSGANLGSDAAFLSAMDPGSIGTSTSVAYSGNLQMDYSIPSYYASGTYFQLGIEMQYNADGYYGTAFGSTIDLGYTDPNGNEMYQATIPYTINAGSFDGFGFEILMNSDYSDLAFPIYVDQIQTLTPVPEPGTMTLAGLSLLGFAFFVRRRHA